MNSPITSALSSSRAVRPEAEVAGPTVSRWLASLAYRFAPLLVFVGVIAVWEAGCRLLEVPSFLLPAPSMIVQGFREQELSTWAAHTWATLRVAIMGFIVAVAVSIPLAIGLATSKLMSRAVYPLIVVIHSMPIVAVAPIIVVTMGTSDLPRVAITFLITFFPIVVTTTAGLLATPPELIELSRSLRAEWARETYHIRLPFALPYIFSALKISTTLAVIGAVVAEFVSAEKGLGYMIQFTTSFFKINQAFAALTLLVVISLCFFQFIALMQRIIVPWAREEVGK